jgi:hypothetical protein
MKLPRDLSGNQLAKTLGKLGSAVSRLGTLASILNEVAQHFGLTREELVARLFL